ncbi:MAG: ATPase, T2SS/T4P/T4SS family [Pseudomonadota bacterium]
MSRSVMRKTNRLNPPQNISASNDAESAEHDPAAVVQQFLDASLDQQVRVIHLEQESSGCRIRQRANGLLSEQRMPSPTFAGDFRHYLQRTVATHSDESSGFTTQLTHRHVECHLHCSWYDTLRGEVVVLEIFNERNVPEALEQTTLDQTSTQQLRQQINQLSGGVLVVSARSASLLCDLYYPLLGELSGLENKVVSIESAARKSMPRINQVSVNAELVTPTDASHVFIDWQAVRQRHALDGLLAEYRTAVVFVQSANLPSAIRQLTDVSFSERQLASNLTSLIDIDRVRLICPHCASAHQPSGNEISQLSQQGFDAHSTLNYATGCNTCDHTGFGDTKTLMAIYPVSDKLRRSVESRDSDNMQTALNDGTVVSIDNQRRELISCGQVEFKQTAAG